MNYFQERLRIKTVSLTVKAVQYTTEDRVDQEYQNPDLLMKGKEHIFQA
jgi:hypothetical protein